MNIDDLNTAHLTDAHRAKLAEYIDRHNDPADPLHIAEPHPLLPLLSAHDVLTHSSAEESVAVSLVYRVARGEDGTQGIAREYTAAIAARLSAGAS